MSAFVKLYSFVKPVNAKDSANNLKNVGICYIRHKEQDPENDN